jgi:hypothetical protein
MDEDVRGFVSDIAGMQSDLQFAKRASANGESRFQETWLL